MEYLDIRIIEIGGFGAAVETLRLPFGNRCKSNVNGYHKVTEHTIMKEKKGMIVYNDCNVTITIDDLELMKSLINSGDDHAKFARLINVWCNITAPRYFWQEMVTYEVGVTKGCSNSTMHQECKGLSEKELVKAKEEIKEGTMQTRTYMFSYQSLRRIYNQRKQHRLPHWREFCKWIEKLPLSKELILC